jgi:hypothetical protein
MVAFQEAAVGSDAVRNDRLKISSKDVDDNKCS